MTTLAPCANGSCTLPVALDGCPQDPGGILCVTHLKVATGADLSALGQQASCQHAAATCGAPATVQGLAAWYCQQHAPAVLRPVRDQRKTAEAKAKSKAFLDRQRKAPKLRLEDVNIDGEQL